MQIFENGNEMMGASNPHPHAQIWATEHVPMYVERELRQFGSNPSILADYLRHKRERVLVRRFMAGYELLAEPQRDLTPEDAAGRLRHA